MAVLTSIERLPLEVLEYIVNYLSDKDLSTCCAICESWRELFSNGTFWKKRCNLRLAVSLENTCCVVEPYFITPHVKNGLPPLSGWRLCFLREQHYLKNLSMGRYKEEKIEFERNDDISYKMKVELVANDYLFLHRTSQFEVWNVAQKPNLVMTIPFSFFGQWEYNFYRFQENKLIVVQCNVVQIFNVCLLSKAWSFHHTFFFDKPEEFSLNITKDTDLSEICKKVSYIVDEDDDAVERVLCGNFLIGIITTKAPQENKVMHVWDLNAIKKVKEENCSKYFGSGLTYVLLQTSSTSQDNIVVTGKKGVNNCCAVYSLVKLQFIASYQCHGLDLFLLCDGYLCIYEISSNVITRYDYDTNIAENVYKFDDQERLIYWHSICNNLVVYNCWNLILINPLSKAVELLPFNILMYGSFEVDKNRFIALHDIDEDLTELWEHRVVDPIARNKQNIFTRLFKPHAQNGTYRSTNEVCTRIVFEQPYDVNVLNFW